MFLGQSVETTRKITEKRTKHNILQRSCWGSVRLQLITAWNQLFQQTTLVTADCCVQQLFCCN